jgi:hypothetical protein
MEKLIWWSQDGELKVHEHEPVSLDAALAIVDRCISGWQPSYESYEQAVAATTCGFNRSDHEFIEVSVRSPAQIRVRICVPNLQRSWFRGLLAGKFVDRETAVESREAALEMVSKFFATPTDELRAFVRAMARW